MRGANENRQGTRPATAVVPSAAFGTVIEDEVREWSGRIAGPSRGTGAVVRRLVESVLLVAVGLALGAGVAGQRPGTDGDPSATGTGVAVAASATPASGSGVSAPNVAQPRAPRAESITTAGEQYIALYGKVAPHRPWFLAPVARTTAGEQYAAPDRARTTR